MNIKKAVRDMLWQRAESNITTALKELEESPANVQALLQDALSDLEELKRKE